MNIRTQIKHFAIGLLLATAGVVSAATFNLFSPATGVLKGNASTYVTSAATSADIRGLWTGTCNLTTFLRGDGACALVSLTANVSGILPVANGGTNLSASLDDNTLVGDGTTWQSKALPNCTDTTGNHLNYTTSTNSFSCGTSAPGGFTGFANPTASVGLSTVNGSAVTAMRSDGAPPLSQSIVPTWTGIHTWSGAAINTAQGSDIASAGTTNLETATGNIVDVTGTTTITAVTLGQGHTRIVRFTGALTLTNGASLVLPGATNIVTAAGDYAVFVGYASSVVRVSQYQRNSVLSLSSTYTPTATAISNVTVSLVGTHFYTRVGNIVTVTGVLTLVPTATATATSVEITLPVASNLTTGADLIGVGALLAATSSEPAAVSANSTTDRALIEFISTTTSPTALGARYTFTYQVLP